MSKKDSDFLAGLMLTIIFIILAFTVGITWEPKLSQETLNDICINLAENVTAVGEAQHDGTLVCTIPSFDSTNNIIIKKRGE